LKAARAAKTPEYQQDIHVVCYEDIVDKGAPTGSKKRYRKFPEPLASCKGWGRSILNSHLEVFNGKSQLQKMRVFQESSDFLLGLISFEGRAVKPGGVHLFKKRIWVLDES